jgi:AraC-like DNA-binding protein
MNPSHAAAPSRDAHAPFAPKAPLEELLFDTPSVGIGTFRCRADHPLFRDSGPSSTYCFVFPRTSVWIQHAGGRAFLADPRIVTFYNQGQVYSRRKLSPEGDRGEWFAVAPDIASEILAASTSPAAGTADAVFPFACGPSDARTYLLQRRLIEHLRTQPITDPLRVEETVLYLLERTVALAAGVPVRPVKDTSSRRHVSLVDDARLLLALSAGRRVRLSDLAARLSCSVYHLCRTFRAIQGTTIHAYHQDLRLRLALERITGGDTDLTRIALDHGYCSHSHFTSAFRAHYGMTPSAFCASTRSIPSLLRHGR